MGAQSNRRIFARCNAETWRIEQILHLGGMLGEIAIPAGLEQLIEGWQLAEVAPALGLPDDAENWLPEDVVEWLRVNDKFGFLVQVATPVKEFIDQTSFNSSWSRYRAEWIYDEDFTRVMARASQWVRKMDSDFRHASLRAASTPTRAGEDHVALLR
ncbi:hypothetical protein [Burkholderia vietnamiensis]|uniref:hypothetical protein n=1 Tax=Burkholderia vietnamiensis TaxID=60552 RepID=UPI001CF5B31C|nr:hypothetical protein [Burkholderia vietnamiensis]MCA8197264.1 hypothetical protein [Burkholderia vietnamiensis]MCA8228280.1 hypothetical protein [Burkholderia vietnamiensis]UEC05439.1 hypothetical protein LK462_35110 [Burkholderia vietnamiensis]